MKTAILKAFNIRKGEETDIILLLLYSFFMGSVIAFFYTSATSLFVVSFKSSVLPWAYIGGGIMSYLVWLVYKRIEQVVSFQKLILFGITFLLVSVGFFVIGNRFFNNKWLPFLMFVWIRVFVFISAVGFWGLAARMFDLRQGKRIFGLISSGEVLSNIVGYFSIPLVLKFIDTSDLLYISLFGLVICLLLMVFMLAHFEKPLVTVKIKDRKKMKTSFKIILKDKYLTLLILMAVLPMFGMCFADYSFLNQIKVEYVKPNSLASFLSIFLGATAVAEFVLKSFVSGRLLNKYGLKVALPILPVVLAGCVFLAVTSGILYGTAGLFFSFIAFTKMLDRVLRSGLYDTSFQILYQPLPAEDRSNAQGMVEGMGKGLGFALAGAVVLLFTQIKVLNLVYFNFLFFLVLGVWVKVSLSIYQDYRNSLGKMLMSNDKNKSKSNNYTSNLNTLSKIAGEEKDANIGLIMNIMINIEPQKMTRFLQQILASPTLINQEKILEQIKRRQLLSAEQIVQNQLRAYPETVNKELFEHTLSVLHQVRSNDFETLLFLSQSKEAKQRTLAARILAYFSSYKIHKIVQALLQDENPETRKAALYSAGQISKRELWPYIVQNLFHPNYSTQAITAIKMIGEPILSELEIWFDKNTTTKDVRIKIISVFSSISCDGSLNFLRSRIQYPDETIRNHVFKALSKLEYHAKIMEVSQIRETIDEEIAITVWVMAATLDIEKENKMPLLMEALNYELVKKKENVFLLLSMLYDSKTIKYIQDSFHSGTHESQVFATELLDLTVSPEIKEIFLPLLEDLSVVDSLHLFRDKYPQQKMTVVERLKDIINKDYLKINRWTKACAIIYLKDFPGNETVFLSNFLNPDPFIMQNAVNILKAQNSERFKVVFSKLDKEKVSFIEKYTIKPPEKISGFSLSEKVILVKKNRLFRAFSNPDIARIVENSTDIVLHKGEELNPGETAQDSILLVLSGKISEYSNSRKVREINENEFYWGIVYDGFDDVRLKAENSSAILVLSPELIFNTMSENSEFTLEVIGILRKTA